MGTWNSTQSMQMNAQKYVTELIERNWAEKINLLHSIVIFLAGRKNISWVYWVVSSLQVTSNFMQIPQIPPLLRPSVLSLLCISSCLLFRFLGGGGVEKRWKELFSCMSLDMTGYLKLHVNVHNVAGPAFKPTFSLLLCAFLSFFID